MATFPDLPIGTETTIDNDNGVVTDRMDDGSDRQRQLGSAVRKIITITWPLLSSSEGDSLTFFLENNRTVEMSLPIGSETYTVRLIDGPRRAYRRGSWRDMTATLRGTLDGA